MQFGQNYFLTIVTNIIPDAELLTHFKLVKIYAIPHKSASSLSIAYAARHCQLHQLYPSVLDVDLLQLMQQAKTNLLIVSPYFVPGEAMMKQFADLRKRGLRVRVLTNSLASNDAPAAHVGYARYREALLALGVEIYEMRAEQEGTVRGLRAAGSGSGDGGAGSVGGSRASLHSRVYQTSRAERSH